VTTSTTSSGTSNVSAAAVFSGTNVTDTDQLGKKDWKRGKNRHGN
jgi:hypothetical protein